MNVYISPRFSVGTLHGRAGMGVEASAQLHCLVSALRPAQ